MRLLQVTVLGGANLRGNLKLEDPAHGGGKKITLKSVVGNSREREKEGEQRFHLAEVLVGKEDNPRRKKLNDSKGRRGHLGDPPEKRWSEDPWERGGDILHPRKRRRVGTSGKKRS